MQTQENPFHIDDLAENLSLTLDHYSIVAITDVRGKIIYVNDNFCKISKYSREELLGNDHRIINSGHHPKAFMKDLWETVKQGITWHGEIKNRAKDGSTYWVDTHIVPHHDAKGQIKYFVAVRVDITSEKEAMRENEMQRHQLLLADKMASLGILTSGVAHEINNPNHLIMSNTELLESIWQDISVILEERYEEKGDFDLAGLPYQEMKEQIPQIFSRIQGGSNRIRNIVENLKKFARKEDPFLNQAVNLNVVVKSALVLVEPLIKKTTDYFSMDLTDDLPIIEGNTQQLEQVVINLITNACQALPDRQKKLSIASHYHVEDNEVSLVVSDEGEGIAEEDLIRIMDPFYTTKRDDGGTGLGLFVSYGIIQNHGGSLDFQSVKGEGTKATISFSVETKR